MPLDGLTSGIDNKISFIDATGVLRFALIEHFTWREDATMDKKVQMDGNTRHPKFHMGESGSFSLQRSSDFMDAYIAAQEARYLGGFDQQNITITQTIQESDGTVSQYQFTNAVITLEDGGNYSGQEIVMQRANFVSRRRIKIG